MTVRKGLKPFVVDVDDRTTNVSIAFQDRVTQRFNGYEPEPLTDVGPSPHKPLIRKRARFHLAWNPNETANYRSHS
ncbi:MAG TPA: hypothetical protein VEZ11_08140 [Thermoanaerobaculia bacterium]|nr:hypothetical protein [Thermoanaerobaculia bacterium]